MPSTVPKRAAGWTSTAITTTDNTPVTKNPPRYSTVLNSPRVAISPTSPSSAATPMPSSRARPPMVTLVRSRHGGHTMASATPSNRPDARVSVP